jgi:hypothetical protein
VPSSPRPWEHTSLSIFFPSLGSPLWPPTITHATIVNRLIDLQYLPLNLPRPDPLPGQRIPHSSARKGLSTFVVRRNRPRGTASFLEMDPSGNSLNGQSIILMGVEMFEIQPLCPARVRTEA